MRNLQAHVFNVFNVFLSNGFASKEHHTCQNNFLIPYWLCFLQISPGTSVFRHCKYFHVKCSIILAFRFLAVSPITQEALPQKLLILKKTPIQILFFSVFIEMRKWNLMYFISKFHPFLWFINFLIIFSF